MPGVSPDEAEWLISGECGECFDALIEDYADTREAFLLIAEMASLDLVAVASGGGALARLRDGLRPCLILLDMNMPVMDGMTFLSHLERRPDREQREVVIMSAAVEVELLGHAPGVLKALKKPFDLEAILVLAEAFAARHGSAGPSTAATATQPTAVTAGTTPPPLAPEE